MMKVNVQVPWSVGIRLHLHRGWWPFLALLIWSVGYWYLPAVYPGLTPVTYWVLGGVAALSVFAFVLCREIGRVLVANYHRSPVTSITLFPFGGVTRLEAPPSSPAVALRVALTGPVVSLLLAAGCWVAWLLGAGPILQWAALFNLGVAGFNLLPAAPLDGKQILDAVTRFYPSYVEPAALLSFVTAGVVSMIRVLLGGFVSLLSLSNEELGVFLLIDGLLLIVLGWAFQSAAGYLTTDKPDGVEAGSARSSASCTCLASSRLGATLLPWMICSHTEPRLALQQMEDVGTTTLLLVENGRIVGTLSRSQLLAQGGHAHLAESV